MTTLLFSDIVTTPKIHKLQNFDAIEVSFFSASFKFMKLQDNDEFVKVSVAEPEPQGAASFGRNRSRKAMRLRLRQWYFHG
jgi:hypothetical protein